jgi:hypothetical protein
MKKKPIVTWEDKAHAALLAWKKQIGTGKPFLIEEFSEWAIKKGILTEPAVMNAWGAFTRHMHRRKCPLIFPCGWANTSIRKASNRRVACLWKF